MEGDRAVVEGDRAVVEGDRVVAEEDRMAAAEDREVAADVVDTAAAVVVVDRAPVPEAAGMATQPLTMPAASVMGTELAEAGPGRRAASTIKVRERATCQATKP